MQYSAPLYSFTYLLYSKNVRQGKWLVNCQVKTGWRKMQKDRLSHKGIIHYKQDLDGLIWQIGDDLPNFLLYGIK